MRISRLNRMAMVAIVLVVSVAGSVIAQPPAGQGRGQRGQGGFGFGFGGRGGGLIGLLQDPKVQTEIELLDDQKEQITKVAEAARASRGGPGGAGGAGGQRPDFQNMTEEERQKFMAEMRERAEKTEKESRAKVAEILLPHQMERLDQLLLQQRGVAALLDPAIIAKLAITDEQKTKMTSVQEEATATVRESARELFQGGGGNREEAMKKLTELRKAAEAKVVAVLTPGQAKAFEELKGKAFEFSPPQGPGGPGGNRPRRPNTDQ